ncbi:hypothetical protein MettiDRAFT_0874 [Methanolobus tindarius DSM 2278]|jgi:hypothetical protein|uniref:Uncharacterized protein n=1 Tax=Methanolobus tindarius DSM 2278 TaxID=1090322 RepID=W9DQ80_METTI|nr:hypothetical protein [Methanolobus tindarius]ETA67450.1 hypothetical protein MettiDRAFT_0874 [Methanolobus tindarius DSM 2278]
MVAFENFRMITENIEGYKEFNIDRNWYKNRKKGLSAVIRCFGDERWIGPCIESCLPLFDEIVVVIVKIEGDRTEEIVKSFNSPKIKIYKYPFALDQVKAPVYKSKFEQKIDALSELFVSPYFKRGSVHTISYLTNFGMSKTTYSHVTPQWDADHILRPEFATEEFKEFILSKDHIRVAGYNVVTEDYQYLSEKSPIHSIHPRFYKADKYLYFAGNKYLLDIVSYRSSIVQLKMLENYFLFPIQQILCMKNLILGRDVSYDEPIYFHTKFLRSDKEIESDTRFLNEEYHRQFRESTKKGKKIDVKVPDFALKTPDDYLTKNS